MEKLPESVDGSIQRLLNEGYALYRRGSYIVAAVPYLDSDGHAHTGLMVDTLNFEPDGRVRTPPINHQMYFVGTQPFDDKQRILFGGAGGATTPLFDGKSASFYWSWKPKDANGALRDYQSLHEKFVEYISYVSGPAEAKFPNFRITPYRPAEAAAECPFPFEDMNAARANLQELDRRLENDVVAVIGVGGTGSYIFDLLSKTKVREIRIIDFDEFDLHNAFRVPGATDREELGQPKVAVLQGRYGKWHRGVRAIEARVEESSAAHIEGVTFAFLAVDNMPSRRSIASLLRARQIPFVVVGMGIHHGSPGLTGMVETTIIDERTPPRIVDDVVGSHLVDLPDEYQKNIQTVELNAMNAAMAVFMYKKFRGYYACGRSVYQLCFTTASMQLDRESLE